MSYCGVQFTEFYLKVLLETNRLTSQKPLAGNASVEQQHIDYFKLFFTDGTFKRYATLQDGSIQLEKVGKMYKISGIVLVSKEQLRSDLEKEGIVKGLNSGF
jgi:deoxyribose-phosphate aldolase